MEAIQLRGAAFPTYNPALLPVEASDDVAFLGDLVRAYRDAEMACTQGAGEVQDPNTRLLLETAAEQHHGALELLSDVITRAGGVVPARGTLGGALMRGWESMRNSLGKQSDYDICMFCEESQGDLAEVFAKTTRHAMSPELAELLTSLDRSRAWARTHVAARCGLAA